MRPTRRASHLHVGDLAVAIERLMIVVEHLDATISTGERGARLPWRNSAVLNVPLIARNGAVSVTWLHVANELGAADAYLHLFDEYQADAVIVGQSTPKQRRLAFWVPAGMGLDDPWIPPIEFGRGIVVVATNSRDGAGALRPLACVSFRHHPVAAVSLLLNRKAVTSPGAIVDAYRVTSDGVNVTAYDKTGVAVAAGVDVGVVLNAVFAVMPAAGAHIVRNDGNVFPKAPAPAATAVPRNASPFAACTSISTRHGACVQSQGVGVPVHVQPDRRLRPVPKHLAGHPRRRSQQHRQCRRRRSSVGPTISGSTSIASASPTPHHITAINVPNAAAANCQVIGISFRRASSRGRGRLVGDAIQTHPDQYQSAETFFVSGANQGIVIIGVNATGGAVSRCFCITSRCATSTGTAASPRSELAGGAGVRIGSVGFGNRCVVRDCYLANSSDVGVEIDGMQAAKVKDVQVVDAYVGAFLCRNFHAASDVDAQGQHLPRLQRADRRRPPTPASSLSRSTTTARRPPPSATPSSRTRRSKTWATRSPAVAAASCSAPPSPCRRSPSVTRSTSPTRSPTPARSRSSTASSWCAPRARASSCSKTGG